MEHQEKILTAIVRETLRESVPHANAQINTAIGWRPIGGLLASFGGTSFMGEHAVAIYIGTPVDRQACGVATLYGNAEEFKLFYRALKGRLRFFARTFELLLPYRFCIPELPGFLALKEYLGSTRTNHMQQTFDLSDGNLDTFLAFGKSIIEMRKKVLSCTDDIWGKYLVPHWHGGSGLYFLISKKENAFVTIEGDSATDVVDGKYVEHLGFPAPSIEKSVAEHIHDLTCFTRLIRYNFHWGTSRDYGDPLKLVFKDFQAAFEVVNAKLCKVSTGYLRELTDSDLHTLCIQDIEAKRWCKRTLDIGDGSWLKPITVELVIGESNKLGFKEDVIAECFRFSVDLQDHVNVHHVDKEQSSIGALLNKFANVFYVKESGLSTWIEGKRLDTFIDPRKVNLAIFERDIEMYWQIDAKNVVGQLLKSAKWDFDRKVVEIGDDITSHDRIFRSYAELKAVLSDAASTVFHGSVPLENGPVLKFDDWFIDDWLQGPEYGPYIQKLGWLP